MRDEMIKVKRREPREAEDEMEMERLRPVQAYPNGRPSKRRSLSTGDAEDMTSNVSVLDIVSK